MAQTATRAGNIDMNHLANSQNSGAEILTGTSGCLHNGNK